MAAGGIPTLSGVDLVCLVHGLWGGPGNWNAVSKALQPYVAHRNSPIVVSSIESSQLQKPRPNVAVMVSKCNSTSPFALHQGIDVCGERLTREIQQAVQAIQTGNIRDDPDDDSLNLLLSNWALGQPVKSISFIGHSMGGLLSRYALARLYDGPGSGTFMGGVQGGSYISLASPHLGCGVEGQHVPFVQLLGLTNVSGPLAGFVLSRTGQQLFQRDEAGFLGESKPMIVSLSEGSPLEALSAMKSRTAYANLCGDSLVGWHTSALEPANVPIPRSKEGAERKFRHVVYEDYHPGSGLSGNKSFINYNGQSDCNTHEISQKLKSLGWERITVSFQDAPLSFLAHTHIQCTRPLLNDPGKEVINHIALKIASDMDWIAMPTNMVWSKDSQRLTS